MKPAVRQNNEIALRSSIPSDHEMMVYHTMAKQAVNSKMYKGIGDESGLMMIMLSARELGVSPMMALNGGLNIIQGKVEISARMMNALIRKAGHQIEVLESTNELCTLRGKRCDTGESITTTFSVEEAKQAGLVKVGGGWTKWPKDMCFARALSRLSRQLFSDVIGIGYVEGEIKASDAEIVMPQEMVREDVEIINEDENVWLLKYLDLFDKEDKHHAIRYLEVVRAHFNWSKLEGIKELMKDEKKLFEKFSSWKSKIKNTEEA